MLPRLLVLTSTYPRWSGDTEPGFVHELSRRLTGHYEVHVLCPHSPGAAMREQLDGVVVHRYRYAPTALETLCQGGGILANLKHQRWKWLLVPFFLLGQSLATARLLRELRPTCIHAHWIIPQGLVIAALRAMGVRLPPVLLTSHGGDLFGLRGGLLSRVKSWVIGSIQMMTVVSRPMLGAATALGVSPEQIEVIPMGVDFQSRFTPGENTRTANQILFVGRLVEKKGVAYLLKAMPMVLAKKPEIKLLIVGYGPERETLEAIAQQLGISSAVEFCGAMPQQELPEYFQSASLFVAPFVEAKNGDIEGFPVALMEAVACQCPLLAGNLNVLQEAFGEFADAILIDPKSTLLFSERIISALENPDTLQQTAKHVYETMRSYLDWDVVGEKYNNTLKRVIQQE